MLTVYNVGQGDAMLLTNMCLNFCCFDAEPLLIDCGPQVAKVHTRLPSQNMRVMITHADNDHIGGLADVLAKGGVTRLYVPRYLPEIERIERFLQKKIKRKFKPLPASIASVVRVEVAEGDSLCTHAMVLNPPKNGVDALRNLYPDIGSVDARTTRRALRFLKQREIDLPTEAIVNYSPESNNQGDFDVGRQPLLVAKKRAFVRGFFIYLAAVVKNAAEDAAMLKHASTAPEPISKVIESAIDMAANQVSIVMHFNGASTWLFTGDADPSVFKRITAVNHSRLSAEYLKVPHHGSSNNIDSASLTLISPTTAIVSHNNGKFGKASDPHPNQGVIDLLSAARITTHYTNDVIKAGRIVAKKAAAKSACGAITFA